MIERLPLRAALEMAVTWITKISMRKIHQTSISLKVFFFSGIVFVIIWKVFRTVIKNVHVAMLLLKKHTIWEKIFVIFILIISWEFFSFYTRSMSLWLTLFFETIFLDIYESFEKFSKHNLKMAESSSPNKKKVKRSKTGRRGHH